MKNKLIIVSLCLFAVVGCLTAKSSSKDTMVLNKFVEPFVGGSKYLEINGRATIDLAILADDQGKVDDWIPIRTHDMMFVDAIERVIDEWIFEPSMIDGEPVWSYFEVKIVFDSSGSIVSLLAGDAVVSLYNMMRDDHHIVVPFKELDRIPAPVEMKTPPVHTSLVRRNAGNEVKFQFFIDQEGNVRLPVVKELDTEIVVAGIILETLMDWKFEPPTKNGKPVMTRAVVPFRVDR